MHNQPLITIGKITGAFGVRGWVRLDSYADPADNLFKLKNLQLVHHDKILALNLDAHQAHQHNWVAKFVECNDRDQALAWKGAFIKVSREQLPALPEGQYYWMDLEGLEVRNLEQQSLGHIDHLFNTGANDVIAVKLDGKQHYIPYVQPQVVKEVNLEKRYMLVDWEI
ncbi:MAG: ribosome maturation factor RimM [Gammaproteobacteria bacterium]